MILIHKILEWSEVWALLIPLAFMIVRKSTVLYLKPVRIYILVALVINIGISLVYHYKYAWHFPPRLMSNNFMYNLHSVVRFTCFAWLFLLVQPQAFKKVKRALPVLFGVFVFVNFIFLEDFFYYYSFSNLLLSVEVCLLLLYCLQYYFVLITEEKTTARQPASFWIVTGLSIYLVINFFIFLFYKAMLVKFNDFAIGIWDLHNISYVILCLFLAKAFYVASKFKY